MAKIIKRCPMCGGKFTSYPSQHKIYCSRKCSHKGQIGKRRGRVVPLIRKICPQCNKEFEIERWRHQKFCSIQCGANYHKGKTYDERKCLNCNKIFKVEAWKKKKFCSAKCGIEFNRGKPRASHLKSGDKRIRHYQKTITTNGKRIVLHRYLMEKILGRKLRPHETIHHIDMNNRNNTIENLYLYQNGSKHIKGHHSIEKLILPLMKDGIIGFKDGIYFILDGGTRRKG